MYLPVADKLPTHQYEQNKIKTIYRQTWFSRCRYERTGSRPRLLNRALLRIIGVEAVAGT